MSIYDNYVPNKTLMQTYVFFSKENVRAKAFFVSTIDRNSSSMYGGRYAETIVREWDSSTKELGDIIYQGEAFEGSIRTHNAICEKLYKDGMMETEEDEQ